MSLMITETGTKELIDEYFENVTPEEYWDFPLNCLAFCESLSSSTVFIRNNCLFRKRNAHLTLLNFKEDNLKDTLSELRQEGYKIKGLNWKKSIETIPTSSGPTEFFIDDEYDLHEEIQNNFIGKKRRKLKWMLKKGDEVYKKTTTKTPTKKEIWELFNSWLTEAKKRHFMVVKGHYLRYLNLMLENPTLINAVYFRERNQLVGICCYEIFKGKAQITVMKNISTHNCFPYYFWAESISSISKETDFVFCGSTADALKKNLCLQSYKTRKLKL